MDEEIVRFRRAAAQENRGRRDVRRRYSRALQRQAADYWQVREQAGDALRDVAQALGVAPWSLRRWTQDPRVRPVHVVRDPAPVRANLVAVIGVDGVRIEGLDVETAAQLVARLR